MKQYFKQDDTIFSITETYPEVVPILVDFGFDKLENPMIRKSIGKTMKLETICSMRGVDLEALMDKMNETILKNSSTKMVIKGVLPCATRLPILSKLDDFIKSSDLDIDYTLPAASGGIEWLNEETQQESTLADIYISIGFNLFFNKSTFGQFIHDGCFSQQTLEYNDFFSNDALGLKDKNNIYTLLGVVPAVFMVNKDLLGDRKMPTTWAEILDGSFEKQIALPIKDLDLFNAMLLGIYTKFGEDGVKTLGKGAIKSMHPSEMAKNASHNQIPLISIAPYFFATMASRNGNTEVVWPEDGAILSPIFMIAKANRQKELQPIIDFFRSQEIGITLSGNGTFPSTAKGIDNELLHDKKVLFPGFDFLNRTDLSTLLPQLEDLYYQRREAL